MATREVTTSSGQGSEYISSTSANSATQDLRRPLADHYFAVLHVGIPHPLLERHSGAALEIHF